GQLTVRGKGNKTRLVYVQSGARRPLTRWLELAAGFRGAAGSIGLQPIFLPVRKNGAVTVRRLSAQTILDLLRRRAAEADVEDFSPHDFRRTFIGDLLDAGADIATVQ